MVFEVGGITHCMIGGSLLGCKVTRSMWMSQKGGLAERLEFGIGLSDMIRQLLG